MAATRINTAKQLIKSTNPGSILASDTNNELVVISPTLGADHLWFYDHSATALVPLTVGTNLSITGTTLNASAGAGGYAEVQEEGGALTARTKINFIGGGITAADDAPNTRTNVTLASQLNTFAAYNTNGLFTQTAAGTYTGRTITGTTNRLTVTNGDGVAGNPTLDISTSYVGQATITTLGTISTGTWNGTAIGATYGGTGQTTYAVGDLLSANTTSTLSRVAAVASGSVLKSAGVNTLPVWGTLAGTDLTDNSDLVRISGTQTITGSKTFSNNITINGTPSANTDAATVGWVLNNVAGLKSGSVRGATTAALAITGRTSTTLTIGGTSFVVDGVTYANNETILVKDSTTGTGAGTWDNGAYTVSGVGSSILLTRVPWMDTAGEVDGIYVLIQDGTANAGTLWFTVSEVTTLGTDAITFTQIQTSGTIGGSIAANQVAYGSASNTITGSSLFKTDGTYLTVNTATQASSTIFTTKGTGTTGSTYGYVHQNSSGTQVLRVADNGATQFGASSDVTVDANGIAAAGTLFVTGGTSGAIRTYAGSATNTGYGWSFETALTKTHTAGDYAYIQLISSFAPTSGTGTLKGIWINNTINQTGGANGITRGLYVNPTLTAAADYRGIEITASASHYALYSTAGKVRFDLGSDANYDLLYRSSTGELARLAIGATSGHVLTSNGTGSAPSWQAVPATVTASNGLTKVTNDIQLGGALTGNPSIDGSTTNYLTVTGARTGGTNATMYVNNTGVSGIALKVVASGTGAGVWGESTTGTGVYGLSQALGVYGYSTGGQAGGQFITENSSTSTVLDTLIVDRQTTGTPANNIGTAISMRVETSTTPSTIANEIKSSWTDVTHLTRTSKLVFTGVNSGTLADLLTIAGSGAITANKYGIGTFTGTAAYGLAVTSGGALIETTAPVTTVVRCYLTGSTSSVIDLDSGTAVTDIDGTNIAFTVPTDLEKVFVVRNGVVLSRSGTVSRDYTLVSATGVLTLATALSTDESLMVYKIA